MFAVAPVNDVAVQAKSFEIVARARLMDFSESFGTLDNVSIFIVVLSEGWKLILNVIKF